MSEEFGKWFNKNLPGILTTISMTSTLVTGVFAVKAGIDIQKELAELPDDTDTLDKVKVALPHLAPVAIGVTISMGTAYAAHHEHTKRYMALASTLAITQKDNKYLQKFKEEAEKKLGVKKAEEVKNEVAKLEADKVSSAFNAPTDAYVWFHDLETGHIFRTTFLKLQRCRDEYNDICRVEPRPISEFYRLVQGDEYEPMPLHEYIGVGSPSCPALILTFGSELANDMSQVYTISYEHCDINDLPDTRLYSDLGLIE